MHNHCQNLCSLEGLYQKIVSAPLFALQKDPTFYNYTPCPLNKELKIGVIYAQSTPSIHKNIVKIWSKKW